MPRYARARVGVKGMVFRRGRVLLLRRRTDLPLYPGCWDLPGGHVEPGESLEAALVREVREETGYSVRVIRPVHAWLFRQRWRSRSSVPCVVVCYECRTGATRRPSLDPTERTEFAWVSRTALASYRGRPNQRIAIRKAFSVR
jgi:8-oxo-dGTP diphosphatase